MESMFAARRINRRTLATVAGSAAVALAGWQTVSAQQAGGEGSGPVSLENSQGITVTGYGRAEGDVDRAILQLLVRFGPGSSKSQGSAGGGGYYSGANVPAPSEDDLANVINAIADGGVPAENIITAIGSSSIYGMFGPGVSIVAAELDAEAVANLGDIVDNAVAAATEMELSFDQVGVLFYAADCGAVSDAAYLAAIEDGRAQAEAVASALGTELGDLAGVTAHAPWSAYASYTGGGSGNGCTQTLELDDALTTYFPSFVPGAEPVFSLSVSIVLTFEFGASD